MSGFGLGGFPRRPPASTPGDELYTGPDFGPDEYDLADDAHDPEWCGWDAVSLEFGDPCAACAAKLGAA